MAEPRRATRFRPCIDLHNGVVKQIVGSTLKDAAGAGGGGASADKDPVENFASSLPSADYATIYRRDGLTGGHVIMLGAGNEEAALAALRAYPNGLQVGGGVTPTNAHKYLDAGASHVIVTSFVFKNGRIDMDKLAALVEAVGRERLVLDLSCRRKPGDGPGAPYYVVTDRWQKFTDFAVTEANLRLLAASCDEFLVHGVDVEGKQCGIMEDLVEMLGRWSSIPCTYAGGIRNEDDVALVDRLGRGRVDYTIGSALDIFGGQLVYADVVKRDQARTRLWVDGGGAAASGQEAPHATGNAARANAALVGVAMQLLLAVTAVVLQRRPAKRE